MNMVRVGILLSLALSVSGVSHAQRPGKCATECPMHCPHGGPGARGGGWMTGPYSRIYDPKTVDTTKGEITAVEYVAPMKGMSQGVHLTLKTDKGEMAIQLGPAWYLDNQEVQLAKGDRVEVRGSRVTADGKPAVIAAEVKKGSETLTLRDASGVPMWRGWR